MRLFTVPAQYRRFVEANLALTLAEVKRDIDRRADEDPRIQRLATVPDAFIDQQNSGTLTILVGVANTTDHAAADVLPAAAGATSCE